tara:strand:+ start:1017 stop:1265 length:249 start_codon:yes stop_codon:yes gene_type:complete
MTKQTIEFTGESLRSAEDLERLIKEAKFEVSYYEKDLKKAQDKIYIRQIALDALEKEYATLTPYQEDNLEQVNNTWKNFNEL